MALDIAYVIDASPAASLLWRYFFVLHPSKTQAYMAVGKPILMAVDGDAASLVKDAGCGIIAESENSTAIAEAAKALCQQSTKKCKQMETNSHDYYTKVFSLRVGVSSFGKIFRQIKTRLSTYTPTA